MIKKKFYVFLLFICVLIMSVSSRICNATVIELPELPLEGTKETETKPSDNYTSPSVITDIVEPEVELDTDETAPQELTIKTVQFNDVLVDSYYYEAVQWAVENRITSGTGEETFSPEVSCTRGQMVTFLWRLAKEPEPTIQKCPFADVNEDAYYYKAVLWALENHLTSGTSDTTFSPDSIVTRGQTVTFLWRYAGKPSTSNSINPFIDVDSHAYYSDGVVWAYQNHITSGTSQTEFSPDANCTRSQIVTFMWRNQK
ncbi:MAG: S-layer homology domain-containing protein [Clostridia bacterium]|nr:S-layer homology domain-containing protein [Clostridia bacterium]